MALRYLPDNPLDFVGAVQRHMPDDFANTAIPLPKRLLPVLKLFTDFSKGADVKTKINIKDGIATFALQSQSCSITKHLAMPWHPDLQAVDISGVSLLCEACRWAERILFTERAVITNAGANFCLCAASPTRD